MNKVEGDQVNVAAGPPMLALALLILLGWSLYTGFERFAFLNAILLVVLTLGAAVINKKY